MQEFLKDFNHSQKVSWFNYYKQITLRQLERYRDQFNTRNPANALITFVSTQLVLAPGSLNNLDSMINDIKAVTVDAHSNFEQKFDEISQILNSYSSSSAQLSPAANLLRSFGMGSGNLAVRQAEVTNFLGRAQVVQCIPLNLAPNATIVFKRF